MKWSLALLALMVLAHLTEVTGQRRQEGRRAQGTSRSNRRRPQQNLIPGGREKVRAVLNARARAETDPDWLRCLNSVDEVPRAKHIVMGRVERVADKGVTIRIKRILKGGDLPSTIKIVSCDGVCCHLRRKDTRLFLLGTPLERSQSSRGGRRRDEDLYQQVATPLRIRLKTLSMIRAAIKDVPYEHQPPTQEKPCEQQFCAWGADCQVDEAGQPYCVCPTTCKAPSATTWVVCGTDGQTYVSMCELRRNACASNVDIRVSHTGSCDEPLPELEPNIEIDTLEGDEGGKDRSSRSRLRNLNLF